MDCEVLIRAFVPESVSELRQRMAGLLTYFPLGRLPIRRLADSGWGAQMVYEAYSSGNCCRFARHSLLILRVIKPIGTISLQRYCIKLIVR